MYKDHLDDRFEASHDLVLMVKKRPLKKFDGKHFDGAVFIEICNFIKKDYVGGSFCEICEIFWNSIIRSVKIFLFFCTIAAARISKRFH